MSEITFNNDSTLNSNLFILNPKWHSRVISTLVSLLMITIYIWMFFGFINLLITLYHTYPDNWGHGARTMITDVIIILASLELVRILQSYLSIGRVKVSLFLDVALIVLIGELISYWYSEYSVREVVLSVAVISVLIVLRMLTIKYSPDLNDTH